MAKDPAFLFYSADFLVGTMTMTMEERGQYITLMCMQHQRGHLSQREINSAGELSEELAEKFICDADGKYYNERLEREIEARRNSAQRNKKNAEKRWVNSTPQNNMRSADKVVSERNDHVADVNKIEQVASEYDVNTTSKRKVCDLVSSSGSSSRIQSGTSLVSKSYKSGIDCRNTKRIPCSSIENEDVNEDENETATATATENEVESEDTGVVAHENQKSLDFYRRYLGMTTPRCVAEIAEYTEKLGSELVIAAMTDAVESGKANWSYCRAILKRYERDGVTTTEGAMEKNAPCDLPDTLGLDELEKTIAKMEGK